MEKLIGRILNYIRLETVPVGPKRVKMLRAEPLSDKIIKLYEEHNKPLDSDGKKPPQVS